VPLLLHGLAALQLDAPNAALRRGAPPRAFVMLGAIVWLLLRVFRESEDRQQLLEARR
jgi:hypothetical protein